MTLDKENAALFYRLWFPLLAYVNRKYHVISDAEAAEAIEQGEGIDAYDAKEIAAYLWSHACVIDEYLAAVDLPHEHSEIIAGWKRCKPGRYILERHLKKGSVFISAEDGAVFVVKGLYSSWKEMLGECPVLLDAVLIPFRDCIISDGLVMPYAIRFGKGAIGDFKDAYMYAKKNNAIQLTI